ncbi:MAG: hypothetical protein V1709_01010 [Planctomycetota bacterium]
MKPFVITFDGYLNHGSRDLTEFCRFQVKQGKLTFPVNIALTFEATCNFGINGEDKKENDLLIGRMFFKIGLQRLKEKLASGNYPKQSTINCEEILITSDNVPSDISQVLAKNCKYQQKELKGLICGIYGDSHCPSDIITTSSFCESCSLPDTNLICSHLVHPASRTHREGYQITKRVIFEAYCNNKQPVDESTLDAIDAWSYQCVPDLRPDCWEQIYELPLPDINIPVDLSSRVVDEIDFLNLLFDKKFNGQFIDISQARSIRDIGNDCKTEEEFVHKVQVIGHLINDIKIRDILPAEKGSDKSGNKLLSIAVLKVFLDGNYQGAPAIIVTNLEHIRTIRDDYPAHTKTRRDVTVSLDALQINYPIQNWQDAWQKVLYAFWDSLNKLRLLIQYNEINEEK